MINEKGITLVELLTALAIVGVIIAVIMSVLLTGTSSADRTSSKQQLQQEANYIVETIRAEYLKKDDAIIEIIVNKTEKKLFINTKLVSDGYDYILKKPAKFKTVGYKDYHYIRPKENVEYELVIIARDKQEFTIKTTFSKLR